MNKFKKYQLIGLVVLIGSLTYHGFKGEKFSEKTPPKSEDSKEGSKEGSKSTESETKSTTTSTTTSVKPWAPYGDTPDALTKAAQADYNKILDDNAKKSQHDHPNIVKDLKGLFDDEEKKAAAEAVKKAEEKAKIKAEKEKKDKEDKQTTDRQYWILAIVTASLFILLLRTAL